ncbi:MAG: gliding motility-associated C-terminal domain-containing protein [Ferruginibacter sp.]|nr:gliding motility-associated C-terminal domain-containing protein [Ferruginibacter sp.]
MFTLKIKQGFIIIFLILPFICIGQTKGCIDSGSFNRFYPTYYSIESFADNYYYTFRDNADNIYMGGFTNLGPTGSHSSILKFNSKNQLVWYKNYKDDIFANSIRFQNLICIDEKANLIFTGSAGRPGDTVYKTIFKFDSGGNYLWGKKLMRTNGPSNNINLYTVYTNSSNELFATVNNNNTSSIGIIAFDGSGNIKWAKNYSHLTIPKFHSFNQPDIISQNNNTLVLCYPFYYNSDTASSPNAINGMQFVKINKADGSIMQHKAFGIYMDKDLTVPYSGYFNQLNYNPASGLFLIEFSRPYYILDPYINHVCCTVDANLNPVKAAIFNSMLNSTGGSHINTERTNIDEQNNFTLGYPFTDIFFGGPETYSYTTINENLDLVTQKKLNLTNLGFPNKGFLGNIAYKKNGIISFQLVTLSNYGNNNDIYLYDNSPYYNGNTICSGIDTPIYVKSPMYIKPLQNITIEEAGAMPVKVNSVYPDAVLNLTLPKQEICTETSICDTIKIIGTGKYHCLTNPIDSFKIIRNPLCKRNTNWQVDSAFIKILSSTDTSLKVQYVKPYRGFVKVAFGGCYLTDSVAIEVNEAKASVSLGNDSMLCPGKSITLKTDYTFKTYVWQDGSKLDSLVATQPGKYWVTVSDSCDNVFADTIEIKPFDTFLQLHYPQAICPDDTAIINLPTSLYNYNWQPSSSANLQNYQWHLFPASSTIFNISGERMPGCILSDTVMVLVKDCPEYMYFPNAFTPNNDGTNDVYKPGYKGRLLFFELTIFNRYGQTVYRTKDPDAGWNGNFNNNKPLPGSYVWICKYQFSNKPIKEEKGMFTLIR